MKTATQSLALLTAALAWAMPASGATFGKLVPIRGMISDLALDERRGVLYAANMTANRIEIIRAETGEMAGSLAVGEAPSTLALSSDQRFLIIGHFGGGLTIEDLDGKQRRVMTLPSEVLAAAFGRSPECLLVTGSGFLLLNPHTGFMRPLPSQIAPGTGTLGVPPGSRPPDLVRASIGVSADGAVIYVSADTNDTAADAALKGNEGSLLYRHQVDSQVINVIGFTSSPPFGPRQVSVDGHGDTVMNGWGLLNMKDRLYMKAQLPNSTGQYGWGSHAYDWRRGVIYAQAPVQPASGKAVNEPWLHVLDAENLAVREVLRLPSTLAGRSLLSFDGRMLYASAQSGVVFLPLESLPTATRLVADQESMLISANWCDAGVVRQTLRLSDPSGSAVDFRITFPNTAKGLRVYPSSGVTPAEITIEVDPAAFRNPKGTTVVPLTLTSNAAMNVLQPIPLSISVRESGRQGQVVRVAGRLVDILSDPLRNRFYVVRQDRNQVLVFDASSRELLKVLPTGNTPTQMTITANGRYLLVGAENSQIATVLDLETLTPSAPIEFPFGHYPRSVAATSNAIVAAARAAGGPSSLFRIDLNARSAAAPARLGIFANKTHPKAVVVSAWQGATAMLAQPDGATFLYEAQSDTWVTARQDFTELAGAIAVLTDDWFLAGNNLLDRALYPVKSYPDSEMATGGAYLGGGSWIRMAIPEEGYSYVERSVGFENSMSRMAQLVETPLGSLDGGSPLGLTGFTEHALLRSVAVVPSSGVVVALSVSGLVVLEPGFDEPQVQPVVTGVVNAADGKPAIGPGGLILIRGNDLAPAYAGIQPGSTAWPRGLGDVCIQGSAGFLPLAMVSSHEILAQLPVEVSGSIPLLLRTPGGSAQFSLTVAEAAPSIIRSANGEPLIIRWKNQQPVSNSNPIHGDDNISIFMTGLGAVEPQPPPGTAAPSEPLAGLVNPVKVVLSGEELPLWWAGAAPGQVGVYRIDARVPWWLKGGNAVSLSIEQGTVQTIVPVRLIAK